MALIGGAVALAGLVFGVIYLAGVAERAQPEPQEIRIELPDAFNN